MNFFGSSAVTTVDGAVSSFTSVVEKLDEVINRMERNMAEASEKIREHYAAIDKLIEKRWEYETEANRAKGVRSRVLEIIE